VNVNINIVPTLSSKSDEIFTNLFFARTFSESWKKVGAYSMQFNLTENSGLWTTIESSGFANATGSNGLQSIKLDLSGFNGIVPFDQEYRNAVKFVVIPDWNSVAP